VSRRYGRKAPYSPDVRPRLQLGAALHPEQVQVPNVVDELSAVSDWPMFLNDSIGDCTCAAAGHMLEAWAAYGRGAAVKVSDADVLKAYEAVSGYIPGRPDTDQGAVMQDVLDYWRKTGIGGHKILAFAEVDIKNAAEIETALYLFGHIYVGLNVPKSAEDQFGAGAPWDVVANDGGILGGHAVDLGYWNADMPGKTRLAVVTWGARQEMTAAFWSEYVEEAWVVADADWISATGGSPPGLDVPALNAQFTALTGQPGPFPIAPSPVPADADRTFAAVLRPWAFEQHCCDNAKAAKAAQTWLKAKGL